MKKTSMRLIIIFAYLFIGNVCIAAPEPPPPAGPPGPPGDAPIDGWIYVVGFFSIIFAYYKINNKNKRVSI